MYNFFNWPALRHSRLIVLAVANTMDLPERTLSNKISSRLGLTSITFPGYTHKQLMEIITSRLSGVPGDIVIKDAIQFASQKVAAVSGDARRALDICRRTVELAEEEKAAAEAAAPHNAGDMDSGGMAGTPTKTNRGHKNGSTTGVGNIRMSQLTTTTSTNNNSDDDNDDKEDTDPTPRDTSSQAGATIAELGRVTIRTIKRAINESTSSPMSQHLRSLPWAGKLFLAAVLARTRRTGVAVSTMGDVLLEARRITESLAGTTTKTTTKTGDDAAGGWEEVLMGWREIVPAVAGAGAGANPAGGVAGGAKVVGLGSLWTLGEKTVGPRVQGLSAAAGELVEAGILAVEGGGGEEKWRETCQGEVEDRGGGIEGGVGEG